MSKFAPTFTTGLVRGNVQVPDPYDFVFLEIEDDKVRELLLTREYIDTAYNIMAVIAEEKEAYRAMVVGSVDYWADGHANPFFWEGKTAAEQAEFCNKLFDWIVPEYEAIVPEARMAQMVGIAAADLHMVITDPVAMRHVRHIWPGISVFRPKHGELIHG